MMQSHLIVKYALKAMERIAPLRLAEKWDNEALEPSVALVVSYHPTIFKPLLSLTLSNSLQASLLHLAATGVSVYSPHTALDSVHDGINDWLACCAGTPENDITLRPANVSLLGEPKGDEGGLGRLLTLQDPTSIEVLVGRIKKHLRLPYVDVGRPALPREVRTVAICAGSGSSVFNGVDADVYFTGEMAHHDVLAAVAAGRYVVLCEYLLFPGLSQTPSSLPLSPLILGPYFCGGGMCTDTVPRGAGYNHCSRAIAGDL
ncbi:GTP cyclohydrolase 1 type 2/Nif3 [Chiua virens]|nr:GTP cyclohydrolase 1 type 2/Nif3 [Chiua virens]